MSAPEEYVVRASNGDLLHDSYMSEQEARQVSRRYGPYATVHKLGPAIEPPEPREWVVMSENDRVISVLLSRAGAVEFVRNRHISEHPPRPYRLMRLVPEDGA